MICIRKFLLDGFVKIMILHFRMPTAMTYGAGATFAMLYMTDWKVVLQYVPFYNSKFEEQS